MAKFIKLQKNGRRYKVTGSGSDIKIYFFYPKGKARGWKIVKNLAIKSKIKARLKK